MKEQTLKSWDEFEDVLVLINEETKTLQERTRRYVSYPLFRGVSDSEYHLESTLDRIKKGISLSEYHRIIKIVHKHVATCTGREWNLETKVPFGEFDLPACEFMAYLRHNGFPSPLTDWTRSPYIATFFAFRDILSTAKHKEYVSIFVYREYCGGGKGWISNEPHIHILGPTIATDSKHYLQQSEYSFCIKREAADEWVFANHENIPPYEVEDTGTAAQDALAKYNIPISERQKVLSRLDLMNITAYSLFYSEPSLMETLALREIILKQKNVF
jgi:hypothetical protein